MAQFVALGTHAPSECPGASRVMREAWQKIMATAPELRQQHSIQLLAGPLHLDPAHKIAAVIEAPNMEAVLAYFMETRLAQVQAMEVWRTTPLESLFQQAGDLEPLF
jgi:hypothetical protein